MMVSGSRWPVGQVVHIYNSAYSLNHLNHHGRWTTPPLQPLVYLRSKKQDYVICLRGVVEHLSCASSEGER